MKQLVRYNGIEEDPEGVYVLYEDYTTLERDYYALQGRLDAARVELNMQIDAVNHMVDSCRSWMPLLGIGDELVRLTSPFAQHDLSDLQRVRLQWDKARGRR